MRILVTGATGFVGRPLCLRLTGAGHQVVAISRGAARARGVLGPGVEVVPLSPDDGGGWARALDGCDAVVHLAGESIAGGRWTAAKKARIRSSRVDLTRTLVSAMAAMERPPAVLVSGSAVGLYGDRGDTVLTEETSPGEGFLAETAVAWEGAALEARRLGTRVALCRTGVVLGTDGGALPPMALPFRMGVGGPVGGGAQYVPWIHQDDLVEILVRLVEDDAISGPVVATAPEAASNAALSAAIARALGRRSWAPVPGVALNLALGEAAALVLDSLRCRPERLLNLGFRWRFSDLDAALADLLAFEGASIRPAKPAEVPDHPALAGRAPRFRLAADDLVAAPRDEVWAFFSRPENLGALSPAGMTLSIRSELPAEMGLGVSLRYGFKLGPVPLSWEAEIVRWEPGRGFSDVQRGGPFRVWWHEHDFESVAGGTRVLDRVLYAPPLGPLGTVAQHLFVADQLRMTFDYRRRALRWRFGAIADAGRGAA